MRRITTAIAVVLLFAVACGDDSLSEAIEAETSGTDADGSGDGGADDGATSDGSGDGGADDGATSAGSGDGGASGVGADTDFCRFNEEINTGIEDVDIFSGDPADLERSFQQIIDNIDRAADLAPGEIRDDVVVLAEGFKGFAEILADYDYDLFAIPEDVASDPRLSALEDPKYEEAGDRVNEFCGFDELPGPDTGSGDGDDTGLDVPDDQMRDIMISTLQNAFGLDAELAECVVDELGLDDPAAIDLSALGDLNDEICGRTVAELFGG